MNHVMYKEQAEDLMQTLYDDCVNYMSWDTTDEDNWQSMCDIIEKLADHFNLKLKVKEEE